MRVIRFMSADELRAFSEDSIFERSSNFDAVTNSAGYCFLKLSDWGTIQMAYQHLAGIVADTGYYAVFDVDDSKVIRTFGQYFDFQSFDDVRTYPEYCADCYGPKDFQLVECGHYTGSYRNWKSEKISLSDVQFHGTRLADVLPH